MEKLTRIKLMQLIVDDLYKRHNGSNFSRDIHLLLDKKEDQDNHAFLTHEIIEDLLSYKWIKPAKSQDGNELKNYYYMTARGYELYTKVGGSLEKMLKELKPKIDTPTKIALSLSGAALVLSFLQFYESAEQSYKVDKIEPRLKCLEQRLESILDSGHKKDFCHSCEPNK